MSELRYNPLLNSWVIHAAARQNRPHLPKDFCPFCPGSSQVPYDYDVLVYKNDFPVLSNDPVAVKEHPHPLYSTKEAYGVAEVILYSPNHNATFGSLTREHIARIVQVWKQRNDELSADRKIEYVYPFENRGEEVGVTMHHPHGQLYAFSWVPPKVEEELSNCIEYYHTQGFNLFDVITDIERKDRKRWLYENDHFVAYLPYFTDYPFGVFVVAKDSIANLSDFTPAHITDLADILKVITNAFDRIYDRPFPYMMVTHQAPVNKGGYEHANEFYRFHIEFYPPLRDKDKVKWYASSEMGAWVATNPNSLEDCAELLRSKIDEVPEHE
ncbi:MAG: galactose-1-phosphate uridylyltransferase [Sphingobacteriales bacterium JAD_PAG50586_3]|nr:MAG: galactose-1-phosphate uridylyltransferase [Sphingobacteriales bacterium JAD_PAG50586_3]